MLYYYQKGEIKMLNEELIHEAQRMLHERCVFYTEKAKRLDGKPGAYAARSDAISRASAYSSACDILLAAVLNDKILLKEFDYYAD